MIDTGMNHMGFRCIVREVKTSAAGASVETREEQTQPSLARTLGNSIRRVVKQVRVMRRALVHPDVPWHAKLIAGCSLLYVFSPIQLIPNFIPIIGQMDDVLVIGLGLKYLRRHVPQSVLNDCESDLRKPATPAIMVTPATGPLPNSHS
jgi:uncharacterized membrane protein YkvA (DUF1232 family)